MATDTALPGPRGVPLGTARSEAGRLLGRLERNEAALRLAVAGATRRMAPHVERLDLLATAHEAAPLLETLASAPRVRALRERAAQHVEVELDSGLCVRLEVLADEQDFVAALVRATGPDQHVAWLEARAQACGLAWRGHALVGPEGRMDLLEEDDLYAALGLERPIPERRETWLPGMEAASPLAMPEVAGVAGVHAREAGGRYPLADMASRAAREGYGWLLATLPRGSDAAAAAALAQAVQACHAPGEERVPVRMAHELAPGAAQVEAPGPRALRLRCAPWAQAAATLSAAPADALLLDPAGGAPGAGEVESVLAGLARSGAALAVRPPPHHPQPEPQLLERALAAGIPLLLLADAHDLLGLDGLVLSVGLARRAGATAPQVLNAWPLDRLDAWLAARPEPA